MLAPASKRIVAVLSLTRCSIGLRTWSHCWPTSTGYLSVNCPMPPASIATPSPANRKAREGLGAAATRGASAGTTFPSPAANRTNVASAANEVRIIIGSLAKWRFGK